jgi:hypothetical protein
LPRCADHGRTGVCASRGLPLTAANWSFSPFREASEAARTVASRSRRSR